MWFNLEEYLQCRLEHPDWSEEVCKIRGFLEKFKPNLGCELRKFLKIEDATHTIVKQLQDYFDKKYVVEIEDNDYKQLVINLKENDDAKDFETEIKICS